MAEKRMFTNKIVSSDTFKEMPLSTQALYFHLGMNADDEGFLNNAKSVQRSILASDDDMKLLIAKNFIIPFESGIIVIKHWKMNNQIQQSRIKPTQYTEEKMLLTVKENKSYTLKSNNVSSLSTVCQQNVSNCYASVDECSVDKCSIDECSVVECSAEEEQPAPQPTQSSIPMTDYEYNALIRKYGKSFVDSKIERAKKYPGTYNYNTISKWCADDYKKTSKTKWNDGIDNRNYDFDALERQFVEENQKANDDP